MQESGERIQLLPALPRSELDAVLRAGLRAASAFDDPGLDMRRGVVSCWRRPEHDKMWSDDPAYVRVEVSVSR